MKKRLKNFNVSIKAHDNIADIVLNMSVFKKGEKIFETTVKTKSSGWPVSYLSFIEENNEPFTLKTANSQKGWDGTLYYSTDAKKWLTWDSAEINSSNEGKLYLRGTGNTRIAGLMRGFKLTDNKRIQCIGNVENLLDYEVVAAGKHPAMANSCYSGMFMGCTSLTAAPELPATTLTDNCYNAMFRDCTALTGEVHCAKDTYDNKNKMSVNDIPYDKVTIVYDL